MDNIQVLKRDGETLVPFNSARIEVCVKKATNDKRYIENAPEMTDGDIKSLAGAVHEAMANRYTVTDKDHVHVEEVQDMVVILLIEFKHFKTAQSYIIYRHMRNLARDSANKKFSLVTSSSKAPSVRCPGCDTVGTMDRSDIKIMGSWGSDKLLMEMNLAISGRDDIPQASSDIEKKLRELRAELENGNRKFHIRLEVEEIT